MKNPIRLLRAGQLQRLPHAWILFLTGCLLLFPLAAPVLADSNPAALAATDADCDGNGVPDDSEPDCNANGVPDACDIGLHTSSSPVLSPLHGAAPQSHLFANVPQAAGDVRLAFEADGDFGSNAEYVNVTLNDTPVGRIFEIGYRDCGLQYADLIVPRADWNAATASGEARVGMVATSPVDSICSNAIRVSVEIPLPGATSLDCDRNGVPDECQPDCNANGIADVCDIESGASADCNANGIPDECDVASGTSVDCDADGVLDECGMDCNANGVADSCDLDSGTSIDCDADGVLDECGTDCNANGVADSCDLASGTSIDCDADGVPDECGTDCNGNGIANSCDLASGTSADCDGNLVPDECQPDCNANGVPDVCDVFLYESSPDLAPFHSGASQEFLFASVPQATGDVRLLFESDGYYAYRPQYVALTLNGTDIGRVFETGYGCGVQYAGRTVPEEVWNSATASGEARVIMNPSSAVPDICGGGSIRVAIEVPHAGATSRDCNGNRVPDECDLASGASADCNANDIPDSCDIASGTSADCNSNGVPDECDIASGTSLDCDGNGVPDECEPDCNANDVADACDIASGTSLDCDGNGVPDECQPDCNENGVADACDIATGSSADCDDDGVPDECGTDCNANGVADTCDIGIHARSSPVLQPFHDGSPQSHLFTNLPPATGDVRLSFESIGYYGATSNYVDVTLDGIFIGRIFESGLAQCGLRSAHLSVPRAVWNEATVSGEALVGMVATSHSQYYCANTIRVWVEVPRGGATSLDCDGNQVPDECDPDCNANGIADACDIASGTSVDCDQDGVPDECGTDCNGNGVADICDIGIRAISSPVLSSFYGGSPRSHRFSNLPQAEGDVRLSFESVGDIGWSSEFADVFLNGKAIGRVFEDVTPDCILQTEDLIVSQAVWNAATVSGDAEIEMVASYDVEPQCANTIRVSLEMHVNGAPSLDCDGNGVPDECDPDCNANGIPDACDLGVRTTSSPVLSPFHGGASQEHLFANVPQSSGDVRLSFEADGDFTSLSEYVDVSLNGSGIGRIFEGDDGDCGPQSAELLLPEAVWNLATASGEALVRMVASSEVGDFCANTIQVSLSIHPSDATSRDCDRNGEPDECQTDCSGNGVPDVCEPDCNLNGVPDDCDLLSGADSDSNANGVLDECEVPTPTPSPTPSPSPTATPTPDLRFSNVSTRGFVGTGDDVMIGGLVVSGTEPRRVLVTGIGPDLARYDVPGALPNPALVLLRGQTILFSNDDWRESPDALPIFESGLAPSEALEAAILADLPPGEYTALLQGSDADDPSRTSRTGVGLVQAFDLGPALGGTAGGSRLANLSTRMLVGLEERNAIAGFTVSSDGPPASRRVLVRSLGPTLGSPPFGIPNVLSDPALTIFLGSDPISENDDWMSSPRAGEISVSGFAPADAREPALLLELPPGAYTVIVTGAGGSGGTGVALVEVYELP